jgi:hypothetical protein
MALSFEVSCANMLYNYNLECELSATCRLAHLTIYTLSKRRSNDRLAALTTQRANKKLLIIKEATVLELLLITVIFASSENF